MTKAFDIILLGATGFTGRRAAQYLQDHAPEDLVWGIAARNPERLKALSSKLEIESSRCFTIDSLNKAETDKLVKCTKIIVSTVGPYSLFGEPIIASCSEFGTHYLDITGEVAFIKQMADKYGALAKKNKCILIPFSGFDSVPAEVCLRIMGNRYSSDDEVYIKSYYSLKGGLNGGTIATMMNKFETGEYKLMGNPRLAMDSDNQKLGIATDRNFIGYDRLIKRWTTPFIMSGINSKVVYRTSDILREYGTPIFESIAYSEHASLGKWYNPIPFLTTLLTLTLIQTFGPFSWFRNLILKFAPKPGEGPSENSIQNGYFKVKAFALSKSGQKEEVTCFYKGDPSNKATVFFLCESALLLSKTLQSNKRTPLPTGFLTPTSALGEALVNHLQENGYRIE